MTLRKISPELARAIDRKAAESRTSLGKAALQLLEKGAGLDRAPARRNVYHDLDDLAGTWSEAEAAEFERNLRHQRRIDRDMWK